MCEAVCGVFFFTYTNFSFFTFTYTFSTFLTTSVYTIYYDSIINIVDMIIKNTCNIIPPVNLYKDAASTGTATDPLARSVFQKSKLS